MRTKDLVLLALFMGIGAVLHIISPPILFGMKPDIMLPMMFLGIMMFPKVSYVVVVSLATGVISALTTGAPGGQISNMIEKPITAFVFFGLLLLTSKYLKNKVVLPLLVIVGTAVSGSVFLVLALYIVGLMGGTFGAMFIGVVLPAILFNVIFMLIVYPIVQTVMQRSNFKYA